MCVGGGARTCFEVVYAAEDEAPPTKAALIRPAMEDVATTVPSQPCACMRGTKAWSPCSTPKRFTRSVSSQSAVALPSTALELPLFSPAFRKRKVTRPKRSKAASQSSATCASSATSAAYANVAAPDPAASFTEPSAATNAPGSLSERTTLIPRAAHR